jgi:putative cardiolipin synthase
VPQRLAGKGSSISGSSASLHAKTFVFDRQAVFIGSLNLDPRSIQLNTEIGVICMSPPLAEALATGLQQNLARIAWRIKLVPTALAVHRSPGWKPAPTAAISTCRNPG